MKCEKYKFQEIRNGGERVERRIKLDQWIVVTSIVDILDEL